MQAKSAAEATPTPKDKSLRTVFTPEDRIRRRILIPNLSPGYNELIRVALEYEGYQVDALPMGGEEEVELGKRFVHNDICFPAQINIGELLKALHSGKYSREEVAVGLSKDCNACRALQYYALARKGLDESGFPDVPIVTTGKDRLNLHPGFTPGSGFRLKALQGMVYLDVLNEMIQKTLPYELEAGRSQELFDHYLAKGMDALKGKFKGLMKVADEAIRAFNQVPADRSVRKPRVGIVGEILVNYHPAGNYDLVSYLRRNGMETVLPPVFEFWRQDIVNAAEAGRYGFADRPSRDYLEAVWLYLLYNGHVARMERRLRRFRFYEKRESIFKIARNAEGVMEQAFNSGEGWLLPGEIITMIKKGIRSFVIVQPFGCMPNHISGRGTIKAIKTLYPHVQLLALDYDPDVSVGNIENRLQMLIITAREMAREEGQNGGRR